MFVWNAINGMKRSLAQKAEMKTVCGRDVRNIVRGGLGAVLYLDIHKLE